MAFCIRSERKEDKESSHDQHNNSNQLSTIQRESVSEIILQSYHVASH